MRNFIENIFFAHKSISVVFLITNSALKFNTKTILNFMDKIYWNISIFRMNSISFLPFCSLNADTYT